MRSAFLILSLASTTLAIYCYTGTASLGLSAPGIQTCASNIVYCFTQTDQFNVTSFGCDQGPCVTDIISNGKCRRIKAITGFVYDLCCCSSNECNTAALAIKGMSASASLTPILTAIALICASVFV